jgi:hypothetical protein
MVIDTANPSTAKIAQIQITLNFSRSKFCTALEIKHKPPEESEPGDEMSTSKGKSALCKTEPELNPARWRDPAV